MATWKRQPQERPGNYFFSGRGLITAGVNHALTPIEVAWIAAALGRAVHENNGLDYLQVFKCEDGRTVWAIDQLSKSMKKIVVVRSARQTDHLTCAEVAAGGRHADVRTEGLEHTARAKTHHRRGDQRGNEFPQATHEDIGRGTRHPGRRKGDRSRVRARRRSFPRLCKLGMGCGGDARHPPDAS